MSDHIPDHVLVNVLLRLPFDSLIRSRCVSKSWRSLIDDPHFIKMHYLNKNHLQTNYHHDDTKIIALVEHGASVFTRPESRKFYTSDSDLSCSSILHAKQLNCPIELSEYHSQFSSGIGFDPVNDAYKVVAFMKCWSIFDQDWSTPTSHEVYVYSSKLNSWKIIGDFPFENPFREPMDGLLVNGALHWFYCVGYILAFDLSSEEFRMMPCPYLEGRRDYDLWVLNGCICLVSYFFAHDHRRCAYISLMEDYRIDESRRNLLTFLKFPFDEQILWHHIKPVTCSRNKKQLLLEVNSKKLVLYDSEKNSFVDIADKSGLDLHVNHYEFTNLTTCVCLESLVRPF
ncbi:F-box protein CPR1-like [Coffea arabica]|uniref:F-box protein CPR1-like n=1 Tax=Coffea arabica TaxID=13443 RepID=A0A6P6V779_COFAR|nr:F-box protein CPR1-like [Coffea arabica]